MIDHYRPTACNQWPSRLAEYYTVVVRRRGRQLAFSFTALLIIVALLFTGTYYPREAIMVLDDITTEDKVQIVSTDFCRTCDVITEDKVESEFCTTWPVDAEGNYTFPSSSLSSSTRLQLDTLAPPGGWRKPAGIKIIGMIFYGRRRSVDILDCYLKQNLVSNGGYLDEVWFMVNTENEEDKAWLRDLANEEERYTYVTIDECKPSEYGCIWERATADDTIYIKIDDDMVYIHPDAIPQLVATRIAEPHPYAVSSQIVNSPVMGLASFRHNWRKATETWRLSELPIYPNGERAGGTINVDAPYRGHPWLLLADPRDDKTSSAMVRTPISQWDDHQGPDAIAFGPGWTSWGVAAQQLYSLLWNLENNEIHRYFFGRRIEYGGKKKDGRDRKVLERANRGGEQLYDMQYLRYNLNFLAIWGRDVKAGLPIDDDELEITALIPQRLGRPFVIDTRSIVAHNSFFVQKDGIGSTDLMDRWRSFANENVCASNNQKKPWDPRCEGFCKCDDFRE
ncbi:hypothetical protein F5Y16DRAFT_408837 [Xylariaceae sp. FL0255]|nr:hypothetical protein F5Y16DRAFT_408837 [Xylariaceae sp. FL0255]